MTRLQLIFKGTFMKIILVAGARPNFMKIAPIINAINDYNKRRSANQDSLNSVLVHTGQHYDINMSQVFFKELGIPSPDINLEVGSDSHAVQTANIMIKFEKVCLDEKPDWIIVVGDINSTMACAVVASKMGIFVAHVEAGLRSFDRSMPEEINRIITDPLSDLLFTPSRDADENLKKEGICESKIKFVGNIMIDTLVANLEKARKRKTHINLGFKEKEFVYVTLHRPSNVDSREVLTTIMNNLTSLSATMPIVFPVHPRTKKMFDAYGITYNDNDKFKIVDPMGYHDSICLAEHARFVLTDSGGLQEETTFFQTPCLTLRPNTERPITITEGGNRLTNPDTMNKHIENVLNKNPKQGKIPMYWDGKTAQRIVQHITQFHD